MSGIYEKRGCMSSKMDQKIEGRTAKEESEVIVK
jgi:hypothetical protein